MSEQAVICWEENGQMQSALWRSESGSPPPKRVQIADDRMKADVAYRLASEGTALLWRGDFHNARQLLQALARRIDRKPRKPAASILEAFHFMRQAQGHKTRLLGMLLLPCNADYSIPLGRAPNVQAACNEAYGPATAGVASVFSLRELQGIIGAHEWRKKGVEIPALADRIHPHYGVFSPIRGEYIDLVAATPLPTSELAFDIGTGTGVLAAVLVKRGIKRIVATDMQARALICARENIEHLGLTKSVQIVQADLFPSGRAPLIVCNPPWLPGRANSSLEHAVYDPDSRMLIGFLTGLAAHLEPGGEGWLILSDFAEHLGLRSREELLARIDAAGLKVLGRHDVKPRHSRAADQDDPLFAARSAEVTSLWRLGVK